MSVGAASWGDFSRAEPELAAFGAERLGVPPSYLATIRKDGRPRVHPVTPILTTVGLYVFTEPTSPKSRDLRERGYYALHNGVPDTHGSGGEFWIAGTGVFIDDASVRAQVAAASSYDPAVRYILFELTIEEVRCNGYGDIALPDRLKWSVSNPR